MGFALEVKKFINSESTGAYAEILLPAPELARRAKRAKAPAAQQVPVAAEAAADGVSAPEAPDEPFAAAQPEPEPEGEAVKLHYLEAGEGEPLILVHTIGQSLYTWRGVFDRLANYYRVIALDNRGHGRSTKSYNPAAYTPSEMATDAAALLLHLGIEPTLAEHGLGLL